MRALVGAVVLGVALAGCGEGGSLTVVGASSLEAAMSEYAASFPGADVRASFAGSDQLAAQIRQGARPDLFASADTEYPARLYREGLVEMPRVFAGNRLVVAVPAGSDVSSLGDLARPGVKVVLGAPSVPVGAYTRAVLGRLPAGERRAIEANVRSEEPEVGSVVAKLEQGAADAGFVYVTDVKAAGEALMTVPIPPRLQPDVAYAAAVVKATAEPAAAREFLAGLVHGEGAADLRRAGFLPPR
ncbi:MAG TPA: molybdate ABC transporter substrate-binding protein [Solirubrobacterales bacterium]|jgi:molybdate transport system substrate-binding protein|nr:molybdate ABC transporter substrate-binding protein [Solirubrobacterales bacterium]